MPGYNACQRAGTMVQAFGFKVNANRTTEPVHLVLDTPDFIVLLPPQGPSSAKAFKAVQVRKEAIVDNKNACYVCG